MRLWLISLMGLAQGNPLAFPEASPYPMPYPMASPYPMERRMHSGAHKEEMNFGGFPAYDKLPYEKRIPAMVRSADVAEDRQGGGGGGFSAPAFNIPFQPNFNFDEFSSPFGSDGSFSQFLSGLGNQGNLGQASPFLQQTEQRFTRPQTPTGQFKRQAEPSSEYRQPPARYNSARSQPLRPEPVYRPDNYRSQQTHQKPAQTQYRQAEPERRQRVQPVYRPPAFPEAREAVVEVESFPKPDFPDMMSKMEMSDMADFELDFEPNKFQAKEPAKFQSQAKHMEEERRRNQNRRIQEEEEKNREAEEQKRRRQEEQERRMKVQEEQERRMRIQEERTRMMEKKEEMKRTQQAQQRDRYRDPTNQARRDPSKKDFSPPTLIEKFQQPIIKSEPFTGFEVPSVPSPSPFTSFKPEQAQSVKVASTKKPVFQYEKKNFREPVKSQARAQSPHPLIRIKPKHHSASPRPQLMSDGQRGGQVKGKQLHSGGFQPFRPQPNPINPNPGKMEVVEVGRQGEPIIFDNEQEIITADRVVKSNKNSFSVDVAASFAPQTSQRGRGQASQLRKGKVQNSGGSSPQRRIERRRSVHLPRPVPMKRGRSLNFEKREQQPVKRSSSAEDVLPYFESARV